MYLQNGLDANTKRVLNIEIELLIDDFPEQRD